MNGRAFRWLLSALPRPRVGTGDPRLTIIRHHRVFANGDRPLYRIGVSESVFEAQLRMLTRAGYEVVTVSEGLARLAAGQPGHGVALTFDDGYADNVTRALPLLRAHRARATFFLTAGWIERRATPWWDVLAAMLERTERPRLEVRLDTHAFDLPLGRRADRARALHALLPAFRVAPDERERRLGTLAGVLGTEAEAPCELATWDEAAFLARDGHEVGAHTMEHPHLDVLPAEAQRREIEDSAALIGRRLGVSAKGLAYPGGGYDEVTLAALAGGPIEWAVTTRAGANGPGTQRFELRRRGLSDGACLGPTGRFSDRLARAELDGAFDRLRGVEAIP